MERSVIFALLLCCMCKSEARELSTDSQQESFACPAEDGFYGLEGQCVMDYYACVSGVAYQQKCPGIDNVFDPVVSRCVALSESSCKDLLTTTRMPMSTTNSGLTFTCPTSNGFFAIPNTCTGEYIICVGGSPYIATCSNNSVFDPETLTCKQPEEASCNKFKCPAPDGFFPIPGACSNSYYLCVAGAIYVQNCPGNAIFDPDLNVCVAAQSASCLTTTSAPTSTIISTVTTTTPLMTTTLPTTTVAPFACPGVGQYPYPGSCTLYYVCSSNGYIIASCPLTQVFNPETQFCERPGSVMGCTRTGIIQFLKDVKLVGQAGPPGNQ